MRSWAVSEMREAVTWSPAGGGAMAVAGGVLAMESGEVRVFRVSVDVRSFRASARLPGRAVNAFVRVVLPQSIVKLAMAAPYPANAAKLTAPLRTHPPVQVAKGTEIVIPNGYVALEFPASPSALSTALAEEPHILAQVLHSDRYMADSVIGVASIPMASLMNETRLDGYAPVLSSLDGGGGARSQDQVNIGAVRVVLALEELGPVMSAPKKQRKHDVEHVTVQREKEGKDDVFTSHNGVGVGTNASQGDCEPRLPMDQEDASPGLERDLRQTLEYEMAWEFEMWRRAEEAKWRADLKDRELARMAALQAEWKSRERAHLAEMERSRKEQDSLEAKLKTKLFELEKLQRKLVRGQEAATLRKDTLQREYAQRVTDAEVAVKRLQTECEHRVQLEQDKYASLLEQHAVLEKRLGAVNKALTGLEKQFADYKAAQRGTCEADLCAQVLVSKQQCNDLSARLEAAVRSKEEYKSQVRRMAKEMASFYREQLNLNDNKSTACPSYGLTRKQMQEQDVDHVKDQVQRLKLFEQTAVTAATAAAAATAAVSLHLSPPFRHCEADGVRPPMSMRGKLGKGDDPGKLESVAQQFEDVASGIPLPNFSRLGEEPTFARPAIVASVIPPPNSSRLGEEPTFAKPAMDKPRVGTPQGNTSEHTKQAGLDNTAEEPRSPETRQPLLEMGQSRRDPGSDEIQMRKVASRRFSDVENDLIDEEGSEAPFKEKEIRRLKRERSELLDTGVYSVFDPIVRGLDVEIRRLQAG